MISFNPENSNYMIIFFDGHKEVVSFEQCKNIAAMATNPSVKLLALNSGFFAVSDIRRMIPTKSKTPLEIKQRELEVVRVLKRLKIKNWGNFERNTINALKEVGIDVNEYHKGSGKDIFNRYKDEILSDSEPKELE